MDIRKANPDEFERIRDFYHAQIDESQDSEFKSGWEKGIYPSDQMLIDALSKEELFIGEVDNKIVAAMVINHDSNEEYTKITWPVNCSREKVMVIHALGILPSHGGKGYAKKMVNYAIDYSKNQGMEAMRLDVLVGNIPAERVYVGAGFKKIERLRMFYEDTGWTDFDLYELAL